MAQSEKLDQKKEMETLVSDWWGIGHMSFATTQLIFIRFAHGSIKLVDGTIHWHVTSEHDVE